MRFEVFGAFWGTFDAGDAVRVHNLTHHGALIEAHLARARELQEAERSMKEQYDIIAKLSNTVMAFGKTT